MKVVKNKMAPPFREVEFDILYGQGISRSGDIIDLAVDLGLVEKSGAWFSCGSERIGQGRENAKAYLEQHPELMDKLEAQILAKHDIKRSPTGAIAATTPDEAPAGASGASGASGAGKPGAKPEVAPDGKPVVRIPAADPARPKNGAAEDPKRSKAANPS